MIIGALMVAALAPASAGAAGVNCRSSALRVGALEPSIANVTGAPCRTAVGNNTIRYGFDTIRILGSTTSGGSRSGSSSAELLRLEDDGIVGPASVKVLSSSAYVTCVDGHPAVVGGSQILSTEATSLVTTPSALQQPINLGPLHLNEATTDGHQTTYRALHLGDVVIGESQAGYSGNPC
jgi:hypothetical protein